MVVWAEVSSPKQLGRCALCVGVGGCVALNFSPGVTTART